LPSKVITPADTPTAAFPVEPDNPPAITSISVSCSALTEMSPALCVPLFISTLFPINERTSLLIMFTAADPSTVTSVLIAMPTTYDEILSLETAYMLILPLQLTTAPSSIYA
jgi:hypothetical protein